jgi:hypothetical protein
MPQYLQAHLVVVVVVALTAQDNTAGKAKAVAPRDQPAALKVMMRDQTLVAVVADQATHQTHPAATVDQEWLSFNQLLI